MDSAKGKMKRDVLTKIKLTSSNTTIEFANVRTSTIHKN